MQNYHTLAYGGAKPHGFLYKRRYSEHVERVVSSIPPERLLVMDVSRGDGWRELCDFLQAPKCTAKLIASSFPALERSACRKSG